MGGIENFGVFQAIDFGITLVVSFHLPPLDLGGKALGEGRGEKNNRKEEEYAFN